MSGKRCCKCEEVKRVGAFSRNKSRKDGLHYHCKACERRRYEENREAVLERKRRYYEENREARREYQRRYDEENREALAESRRRYREEHREALAESRRRYREEHREALAEGDRRRREAMRDMTQEVATRNGEPYTPAEDAHILASDEPAAAIAVDLGRTMESIHRRRGKLRKAVTA